MHYPLSLSYSSGAEGVSSSGSTGSAGGSLGPDHHPPGGIIPHGAGLYLIPLLQGKVHDPAFPARHRIQRDGTPPFTGFLRRTQSGFLKPLLAKLPIAVAIQTNPTLHMIPKHEIEKILQRAKSRAVISQKDILIPAPDFKNVILSIPRFYGSIHMLCQALQQRPGLEHLPGCHGANVVGVLLSEEAEKLLSLIHKFHHEVLRRKR
jgi:hypothetical protein